MSKKQELSQPAESGLFDRVATILDQARSNVARSVNSNMVLAYWLIGREIVQERQGGDERAECGRGFSRQTLWNFRLFYQIYANRSRNLSPAGRDLAIDHTTVPLAADEQGGNA